MVVVDNLSVKEMLLLIAAGWFFLQQFLNMHSEAVH